jgi:hypothetical protein
MALNDYLNHLQANPGDRLTSKDSTPHEIIEHAKTLGHDVTHDELDEHANSDASLDATAGGGSCYANGITVAVV